MIDRSGMSADEMLEVARACFDDLPREMRAAARRVSIRVEEFAEQEILDEFEITDPYELTGLYHGVSLIHESESYPSIDDPLIFLYRQPILMEWRERGDVDLEDLVIHVFIHELGHHFGWSDDEMHALLDEDD